MKPDWEKIRKICSSEWRLKRLVRRSKREILLDILRLVSENHPKKTEIMYKCNLSWSTLDEALGLLLERNFISKDNPDSRKYVITARGKEILKLHGDVEQSFS